MNEKILNLKDLINKKEMIEKMKAVLKTNYSDIDEKSLSQNLDIWATNKQKLYDLLSTSPYWNEKELCIHLKTKVIRPIDINRAKKLYLDLLGNANVSYTERKAIRYSFNYLVDNYYNEGEITENIENQKMIEVYTRSIEDIKDDLCCYDELKKISIRVGQKKSKVLFKIVEIVFNKNEYRDTMYYVENEVVKVRTKTGFKETHYHTYEQLKAKICDCLSPLKVDEEIYISINPLDYLTMSHGNSWSSCHSIRNDGCYHAATFTTLTDTSTIIVYTLPQKVEKDFSLVDKKARQMLFISKDIDGIFQQVFYPYKSKYISDDVRQYIEELIANYKHEPNLWTKVDLGDVYIDDCDYLGYRDWEEGKDSWCFKLKNANNPHFRIGENAFSVNNHNEICCNNEDLYSENDIRECICCGCSIEIHNDCYYTLSDGYIVCEECYENFDGFYCHGTHARYINEDSIEIDGDTYLLSWAKQNLDYKYCEDVEKYRTNYKTIEDKDGRIHFVYNLVRFLRQNLDDYKHVFNLIEDENVYVNGTTRCKVIGEYNDVALCENVDDKTLFVVEKKYLINISKAEQSYKTFKMNSVVKLLPNHDVFICRIEKYGISNNTIYILALTNWIALSNLRDNITDIEYKLITCCKYEDVFRFILSNNNRLFAIDIPRSIDLNDVFVKVN